MPKLNVDIESAVVKYFGGSRDLECTKEDRGFTCVGQGFSFQG